MNRYRRHCKPWTFATELADQIAHRHNPDPAPTGRHRKEGWSWND